MDSDNSSIHDWVIDRLREEAEPPRDFVPDLLGVFIGHCRQVYGANWRDRAIEILRIQQQKGLETYGVPLTPTTDVDGAVEALHEEADALVYSRLWEIQRARTQAHNGAAICDPIVRDAGGQHEPRTGSIAVD